MTDKPRALAGFDRRAIVKAGFAAAVASALPYSGRATEPAHDTTYAQDFDELWETLRDHYCFFDGKSTDWNKVRETYRPRALAADSAEAFQAVIGLVLCELYDAHTHLNDPPDGSRRWPLYDLLVERARNGDVRIAAIQPDSSAADAGLRIGDVVTAVNGMPLAKLIADIAPKCLAKPDPEADAWSINVAVAGQRGMPRAMQVRSTGGATREVALPLKQRPGRPGVQSRKLDGGLGYIAIHTFADATVVDAFETALADLRDSRALIIDVRGNGGGDTAVARPIMGRFITRTMPYATMRRRESTPGAKGLGAPWTEWVDARGPFTYINPVVVLADHWSGSMAEGFPMGMRGIGRARIVGTPMMGLGAAVFSIRLDRTGVQAQYSGEPVYDVSGHARWTLRPDVAVPDGQDILAAGVETLKAQLR
jgi:carboxyl-terminal processing protease